MATDAGSNAEPRLRAEIAVCTRMLNAEGLLDYSGHVSVRLPGREAFLIQPLEQPRGEVSPDSLRIVDFAGVAEGDGEAPPAERYIHCEIYRSRPDVEAIAHVHPDTATLFSLVDGVDLVPVKNHAARWASGKSQGRPAWTRELIFSWSSINSKSCFDSARPPPVKKNGISPMRSSTC